MVKHVLLFGPLVAAVASFSTPVWSQRQPPVVEADLYDVKAVAAELGASRPLIVHTQACAPATPKLEELPLKKSISQ